MPWSPMWGISGRLNNTRQVPAPRAFVSDQTGLVEERRDGRDLSHLCCFASRTQQGSSRALTRHGSSFTGAPHTVRSYSLTFPPQLLGVGCERLREWLRSHVAVTAFVSASHRVDAEVEKIVGRLSLEQTVSAARWQAEAQLDSENHQSLKLSGINPGCIVGSEPYGT